MKHIKKLIVVDSDLRGEEYREEFTRPSKAEIREMCTAHAISYQQVMSRLGRLPIDEDTDWVMLVADDFIESLNDEEVSEDD